jgi:DNA-binding beta-propeller fold protein YncE
MSRIFRQKKAFSQFTALVLVLSWQACGGFAATVPSLVFSADDQTSEFLRNTQIVRPFARPGALTAVDFSTLTPRVWQMEGVPCSVIGPPTCIAATADGSVILVAGAMKVDPADPSKVTVDSRVTRLRWTAERGLEVVAQSEIGGQPSGVALGGGGHLAYVTLRSEGKIAILDLSGESGLRVSAVISVASPGDSLSQFALSPDETRGLATLQHKGAVLALDVTPGDVRVTQELPFEGSPYDLKIFADGKRAAVGCATGDKVCILAREGGAWRIDQTIPVGHSLEGIAISPDQKWVAATCFNGALSPGPKDNLWYREPSRISLLAVDAAGHWSQKQAVQVDSMPQSAVFSPDGRYLVAGEYGLADLRVFRMEEDLWVDTGMHIEIPGQPAALDMAGR